MPSRMPEQTAVRAALHRTEAQARAAQISDVEYRIDLDLEAGAKAYRGDTTVRFRSSRDADTFVEFAGGTVERAELNGADVADRWDGARLALPGSLLGDSNELRVTYENAFDHTGEGFHQFVDPEDGAEYLYTQFEPYAAQRVFPCFDQPDLKATYEMAVTAPAGWEIVANGPVAAADDDGAGRRRTLFERTQPFSTYLVAVVAGPFHHVHEERAGVPLGLYCRASLASYLDPADLFDVTGRGLEFFSEAFGLPYPFSKYDQIFVPEFNWGGMENVGAVTMTDMMVYRDPPTRLQLVRRAEVVLHELAHMWFGDLVTMRWWDDLWLNESFASIAAYLAIEGATELPPPWQYFNTRDKAPAYRADQLPTTHPIADEVDTTDEVFLNFDAITYGKGASALRQLVAAIGDAAFRKGLQTYFERHAFGNAELVDFLAALQEGSGRDLAGWAARWLRTTGVNTLDVEWSASDGRVTHMHLEQGAAPEHPTLRPHAVAVGLVYDDHPTLRVESVQADIDGAAARVAGVVGRPAPDLVYPNHGDLTYAKVALDPASLEFVRASLSRLDDGLLRQLIWTSLWDMVRDRNRVTSASFLDVVARHLPAEGSLPILQSTLRRAHGAVARYLPDEAVAAARRRLVEVARTALDTVPLGDARRYWAGFLVDVAEHPDDLALAGRVVDGVDGVDGLTIDQDTRWALAVRWSAFAIPGAAERVAAELARDPSDRGRRAELRADVSRPDPAIKEEAWRRINGREYGSLYERDSAMAGFGWRSQRNLLDPYVEDFFSRVHGVFASWQFEEARAYFLGLYPYFRVDPELRALTTAALAASEDTRLTRLLTEALDDLDRALAVREFASHIAPDPGVVSD